jgi:hypothetical protein
MHIGRYGHLLGFAPREQVLIAAAQHRSAARTWHLPPQMARVPRYLGRQVPLSRLSGASPTKVATCLTEP